MANKEIEVLIESNIAQRETLMDRFHPLGVVTDRYGDGSFNFRAYDDDCLEEVQDICEQEEIECRLV